MKRLAIAEDFLDYMYKYIGTYNEILQCEQINNTIYAEVDYDKIKQLLKMTCISIELDFDEFAEKIQEQVEDYNFNYDTDYKAIIYEIENGIECVFDDKYKI